MCIRDRPKESKFKIYISALTQLNIDEHNRIPTTDGRLLRRMVRDARTRGNPARETIRMWPSVRKGEEEKDVYKRQPQEYLFLMEERGEKKSRVVCDYIAGMSDIYAIDLFEDLFVPQRWKDVYKRQGLYQRRHRCDQSRLRQLRRRQSGQRGDL